MKPVNILIGVFNLGNVVLCAMASGRASSCGLWGQAIEYMLCSGVCGAVAIYYLQKRDEKRG